MQKMIKTRAGREIISPTSEEDASITAAALSDPDAQPLNDAELARLRPARGRPVVAVKRPMLSMRVDPDVLAYLRASGKGWQTKVNALLRQALERGEM
jgi:uncharacterized protein (DUF4415 family)